jgi:hypothetical protein
LNTPEPVKVAVIDAGFWWDAFDHPLSGRLHQIDPVGEDWTTPQTDYDASPGEGCRGHAIRCWHGTAVLGILAAMSNNSVGIAGALPDTGGTPDFEFVAVKHWDDVGLSSTSCIVRALDAVRQPGAYRSDIVICPWAWMPSDSMDEALENLREEDIPVLVSAGNDGWVDYPATSPDVIAIGATNDSDWVQIGDRRGGYFTSGIGSAVDFVAPGVFLWTWDLSGLDGWIPYFYNCNGQIHYNCVFNGTSASVAVAGGVAAMVLAKRPEYKYSATFYSLYAVLQHTSEDQLGDPDSLDEPGWDWYYGHGRVNAYRALLSVMRGDIDNSGAIDATDLAIMIDVVFFGGHSPLDDRLADVCGDTGGPCDGAADATDLSFLIDHVHYGGPAPANCYIF